MSIEGLEVIRNQGYICEMTIIQQFFSCIQFVLKEISPN